jgi:integrase
MASRMRRAHLRALHTSKCKGDRLETSFEDAAPSKKRCDCNPRYRIQFRNEQGKWEREVVGRDRKEAERKLAERLGELGAGTWERPARDIGFTAWADEWYDGLVRPKENTLRDYRTTMKYAKASFGDKPLREIRHPDLVKFLGSLHRTTTDPNGTERKIEASATTKRKHLRVLSATFAAAGRRGHITANPVEKMDASELPRATTHRAAWFEDDELVRIAPEIPKGLYRTMFEMAYRTGLREGELIALTWGDVVLLDQPHIRVRRTYVEGLGLQNTPKSKAGNRDVFITSDVVGLLGEWLRECGNPDPDVIVFPGSKRDGFVSGAGLTRKVLYPALERAGVVREHEATGTLRTWHSLRHTYARIAIESGLGLKQLQEQLGHESWAVTDRTYSHISPRARAAAVEGLKFAPLN